jgi:hypothetical protein
VKTGQQLKEDAYGKVAVLLAQGKVVIPAECADLVSQLLTVTADPTAGGRLRIGTPTERVHDDLADAFCFMLAGLPEADQLATVPERPVPDGVTWADSVGGVRVPVPFTPARPDMSYRDMHGGYWTCPKCRAPAPAYKTACQAPACDGQNPQPLPGPAPSDRSAATVASDGEGSVAEPNYWNQHMRRCLRDFRHAFDGSVHGEQCPHCRPGQAGPRVALAVAFAWALQIGPRR